MNHVCMNHNQHSSYFRSKCIIFLTQGKNQLLSKYESNVVSAALEFFFNSEPSFSLEGRIIRKAKEQEKKK